METSSSSGRSFFSRNNLPWPPKDGEGPLYSELNAAQKDQVARSFAPRIRAIALHFKARLPGHIEVSELMAAGALGLMEALNNFQPAVGVRFETFADNRIRGAILDELRRMDWFSRGLRQKMKRLEQVIREFEQENGQAPSREELSDITGQEREELESTLEALNSQIVLSLEGIQEQGLEPEDRLNRKDPAGTVLAQDIIDKLTHLIDRLTEREQMVLSLYYTEELNMKEIGAVLNVTEGRVSQIHSQALAKLKKMFQQQHGNII